jgi:hypothetical protein
VDPQARPGLQDLQVPMVRQDRLVPRDLTARPVLPAHQEQQELPGRAVRQDRLVPRDLRERAVRPGLLVPRGLRERAVRQVPQGLRDQPV